MKDIVCQWWGNSIYDNDEKNILNLTIYNNKILYRENDTKYYYNYMKQCFTQKRF